MDINKILRNIIILLSLFITIYLIINISIIKKNYENSIKKIETENKKRKIIIDSLLFEVKLLSKENKKLKQTINSIPIHPPLDTLILISDFGWRRSPIDSAIIKFHNGIDYKGNIGDTIYASADGYVYYAGWLTGYGKTILLNHLFGIKTLYAHLNKIFVKNHQIIKKGNPIGIVGSTGKSTGSHLHFEIWINGKQVDPKKFLNSKI